MNRGAFCEQIKRVLGYAPDPGKITPGKITRFATSERRGDEAGWCKLFPDGEGGVFGCWRQGISELWQAHTPRTPGEEAAFMVRVKRARAEAAKIEAEDRATCRKKSAEIWNSAESAHNEHPYLLAKAVKAYGVRQYKDALIVPVWDAAGTLHGLQFIEPDGTKKFKTGTAVAGCYHAIGKPDGKILISEGYATAATLHEATRHAVACAFNAGNLKPVAEALRAKFPNAELILCADDDHLTNGNPGIAKATEAAQAVDGLLVVPIFPTPRQEKDTDFNDLARVAGFEAVKKSVEGASTIAVVEEAEDWPEPIPLDGVATLPKFPVDVLPDVGREMVTAVSEANQVDAGLPTNIYLAVLSTCLARKVEVDLGTHKEPINIFTLSVLDSGERKSSTLNLMTAPLYEWQKARGVDMRGEISEATNRYQISEVRLAKLRKDAANTDNAVERAKILEEANKLTREMEENPIPSTPTLLADDITPEKVGPLMAENDERLSIISAEGGIFSIMAGRYSEKAGANLDLFLKGHAGDPWSAHRIGRGTVNLEAPALTMSLLVQPDVMREIGGNKQFRGRGLTARFLYAMCTPQAGRRTRQSATISENLKARYSSQVKALLEMPLSLQTLRLSGEAQEAWDAFYTDVEAELSPNGSLAELKDWGSKLPGAVARIAGLLHFAEHGPGAASKPISVNIVNASCVVGGYFIEHALAAFALMREDPRIEAAKKVLEYIIQHNPDTFKVRDVMRRKSAFKTTEDVAPGLKILAERGYIREAQCKTPSTGGRPEAMSYTVNPKLNYPKTIDKSDKSPAGDTSVNIVNEFQEV